MLDKLKNIPKIELHLHLDGSVRIETVYELLNKEIPLKDLKSKLTVSENCLDLNEYLKAFEIPLKVMQIKENLERIAYELVCDLKKENVIYAEIRFAPALHLNKGLNQREVVEAVLKGIKKENMKTNLILCCMRGKDNLDKNIETVKLAKEYINKGVCGIDLAGAEKIYPTKDFKEIFELAKKEEIPFTIHAGEADGVQSIETAINFGTKRVGHGIRCIESEKLVKKIIDEKITLEICPTSNVQTKATKDIAQNPIYILYKQGVKTTINTDNRTVSEVTLTNEYIKLIKTFNFTIDDIKQMNINAIEAAFISNKERKELEKYF